jgi:hypothetical protein
MVYKIRFHCSLPLCLPLMLFPTFPDPNLENSISQPRELMPIPDIQKSLLPESSSPTAFPPALP